MSQSRTDGNTSVSTQSAAFVQQSPSKGNSGNANVIVHHGNSDYQFKATSISTVTFPPADSVPGVRATFSGTGNILDITNPTQPVTLYTGATIQVSMHDAGEPGTSDTIGFTIRLPDAGKTLWYSNNLVNSQTVEALRDGGNIQVRAAQLAANLPAADVAATEPLTPDMLKPIVAAAEARWEAAGIDPRRLNAVMENVSFRLDNLTGTDLAWSSSGIITIDRNADGYGWFIDPTPGDDSEFTPNAANSPAQGHMDLLSVVAHEIGHQLGFGEDDGTQVMGETLAVGGVPQAIPPAAGIVENEQAPAIKGGWDPQSLTPSSSSTGAVGRRAVPVAAPQVALAPNPATRAGGPTGRTTRVSSSVPPAYVAAETDSSGNVVPPATNRETVILRRFDLALTDLKSDPLDPSILDDLALIHLEL